MLTIVEVGHIIIDTLIDVGNAVTICLQDGYIFDLYNGGYIELTEIGYTMLVD